MLSLFPSFSFASSSLNFLDYDYIVVGGGAAGTTGAFTLAETGRKVLLLERGQKRSAHPLTQTLAGTGVVLTEIESASLKYDNSPLRSVVSSPTGVLSHTANVLGGGTSVNMGILLAESADFWSQYETDWSFPISDIPTWIGDHQWVADLISHNVPPLEKEGEGLYDKATKKTMEDYYNKDGNCPLDHRVELKPGCSWHGKTLFDYSKSEIPRNSIDILLEDDLKPESLTVMTNMEVERLSFPSPSSRCLHGHKWIQGTTDCPLTGGIPFVQKFFKCGASAQWTKKEFTFCLDLSTSSGIILAAGALETPLILMRSGIGPKEEVQGKKDAIVVEEIGKNLTDRYMTFASLYGFQTGTNQRIVTYAGLAELDNSDDSAPQVERWQDKYVDDNVSIVEIPKQDKIYAPWEDLGGGDMVAGVGMATRAFFPPDVRSDPNIVLWSVIQSHCLSVRYSDENSDEKTPSFLNASDESILDKIVSRKVCALLEPTNDCFRYSRAMFTMDSSPESRGEIKLSSQNKDGKEPFQTNVYMPYMDSPQDRRTHVESIKHLWKSLTEYEEFSSMILATPETEDCPLPFFRAFTSFLMGDLLHKKSITQLKTLLQLQGGSVFDAVKKTWDIFNLKGQTINSNPFQETIHSNETIEQFLNHLETIEASQVAGQTNAATTHPTTRAISRVVPWLVSERFRSTKAMDAIVQDSDNCDIPKLLRLRSLPPLPCMINDETAMEYISTYGTSLWHWLGSVRRSSLSSSPVDESFALRAVSSVFVIDASIYPHNPRLNPQVTVMAGGRFAAREIMMNEKEKTSESPS